jgi:hypothetical protein
MADIHTALDHTDMWSDNKREMKAIVTSLVEKHKDFAVRWNDEIGWTIRVDEDNEIVGRDTDA